jgi:N-succinyldiaminopimelate aminotransferase
MIAEVSAFDRLRRLLRDRQPPHGVEPALLHLGEMALAPPPHLLGALARAEHWSKYPPLGGTAALRDAYRTWLGRRFGAARILQDPALGCEPTPGSKQALAALIALAVQQARARGVQHPAVVLPNPFYPTYLAATRDAGATPLFYRTEAGPAGRAACQALARSAGRAAALVVCSPGSPQGDPVDAASHVAIAGAAREAGAMAIVDECYVDSFAAQPPDGMVSLWERRLVDPHGMVALHTLSKRSCAPGLRSGFLVGGSELVARYASHNRTCGVPLPLPVCEAAAALWDDEQHVEGMREAIARNWDLADAHLGGLPGYRRAASGFFMWLPVRDDEAATARLWSRDGVMVMPGRYLAAEDQSGVNPGVGRLRIALVHDARRMTEALQRLRETLEAPATAPTA